MRQVSVKFVPRVWMVKQKQQCLSISLELCNRPTSDSTFLGNVIMGDETWVYGYDPETRVQSSQWKLPSSPCAKKVHQSRSNIQVMKIVFSERIVRAKFVPRNTMVNSEYNKDLLERLRNDVRRKWPEKLANGFIFHHDNAPCHTSLLVRKFLSNKNIMVYPHPPYSPNLAPCDFWLFPKVKMTVKGKRLVSIQDIEAATTVQLKTLEKEDFQNCFRKWQERWDKCVRSGGSTLMGINGNVSFTVIIFFI